MKFLIDQDVYEVTIRFLKDNGHDVIKVSEIGHSCTADETLLQIAIKQQCIFITRDRDFGALVFIKKIKTGVIYLRITPSTVNSCHIQLAHALQCYDEKELKQSFIVIEPGRHRFRRIE